ncbi:MAG: calcium-binding protein, partial [Moorea sp. SIO4A3]|nr:calcium-binding protein [Moorena sp. SIO4A3]
IGYLAGDKPEGLALLDDGKLAVLNDNDFGVLEQEIPVDGSVPLNPNPTPVVLGLIDLGENNALDASNEDDGINIQNWPVFGLYQPDAIASFEANGQTYYVTANEGDIRDEEERIANLTLDPEAFPDAETLQQESQLGRLRISTIDGDLDNDGDFDQLFAYGGRSFSIWDEFGNLVFDSGDDFERITAQQVPELFNSSGTPDTFDDRSDNQGPEPEGIVTGVINDRTYTFIGLERIGGVIVYDVTNPTAPEFVQYLPNDNGGNPDDPVDREPEGLTFIPVEDSPNGEPLLVVAQEDSKTITVFSVNPGPGTPSDDELVGTEADETIIAGAGNDLVAGGLGNDTIFGGNGDDVLRGDFNSRSSDNTLGGDDVIYGGAGSDRIGGKAGNDSLFGQKGDDQIWGDAGDDLLRGGLGNDTLFGDNGSGGDGSDTFILAAGEGTDKIGDFQVGEDFIGLADGLTFGQLSVTQEGNNAVISFGDETLAILNHVQAETLIDNAATTFIFVG